ncbi:peptidyl-prolyl cis-trans isomerase [Leptospira noguchii]|uniref:peptidylprolyl isomerase n=1 Tax=Leptospira noguchii TaxID=28182 RepID=UPI001146FF1B|nr:peptidylprolyl isomerase [Leptospira noguchii]TQE74279.1 peptidyl-prolyl cis-trans isomerase [Leptospira noguchii]UOG30974.1 peptidyl-prolyl cis-trans isomerase [Leptospira noguchii]UOG53124.1 peptidyl-prolyl cis-trans isomerase [Leptospira noguchii]
MFFEKNLIGKPKYFLGVGALFGFLLALIGLLFPEKEILLSDTVAEVNGNYIKKDEYFRTLTAVSSDSKNPITQEARANVLERLIEEELLVQRGLELGFAREDRLIRASIVRAVIQSIISENVSEKPNVLELRSYFFFNRDKFLKTSRYQVAVYKQSDEVSAVQISKELRETGHTRSTNVSYIPNTLLPLRKLLDYLGPDVVSVLENLKSGEVSDPIKSEGKFFVVKVIVLEPGSTPDFESVREEVEASYIQEKGDKNLREYLDRLKTKSKIKRNLPSSV